MSQISPPHSDDFGLSGDEQHRALDRVPPQSADAERAVLGSLMLDKEAIVKIGDLLHSEHFYDDKHAIVYDGMMQLYEKHTPIDLLSLSNLLSESKKLEKIGGRSFLAGLASSVPTASNVLHHAKIVHKKSVLRGLITASNEIAQRAYAEKGEVDQILDEAEQHIFSVSQTGVSENFVSVKSVLNEAFDRIDEIHKRDGQMRGTPTGFSDLDAILAGLQPSDLLILAARPSVGKTSFALDIARNVAEKAHVPVGLFSLEMSKEQLVDRVLCSQAHVDSWKLRTGKLNNEDFERINYAMGNLAEIPLYIEDTAGLNVMQMRTMARRLQSENGLGLIIVDYLQLMEGRSKSDNRVDIVSDISRSLKSLARELNVPVLALSQLSRAVESREGGLPKLSDLRESGSIEQDADIVMFIHREDRYKTDPSIPDTNIAKVIIAKHRNGPVGEIKLFFQAEQASFRDLSDHTAADPFGSGGSAGGSGGSNQQGTPMGAPLPGGGGGGMPPIDDNVPPPMMMNAAPPM